MTKNFQKNYSYQISLIPELEGGYTVLVPALPGCVSFGRTAEEATENAKEAIEIHLSNLIAHKKQLPKEIIGKPIFSTFIQVRNPHYA